ncbi:TRAP transporter small permease [Alkalihalobacillus oceani]|uniref:TRAP transporter small permease n=1 Tax=Halalkalibacter oceani TaxID=1653776 RepID=A0A9X2IRT4_9BACI|nr:TRAP transporter small permease [Halalkalibacter oceani]MCM3715913.1 TRAP transporter small permease [Halalkalibacter oceani]
MIVRIKSVYDRVIDSIAILLLVVLTYVSFHQVITRFIFSNPPAWTEELSRYLFVWVTFLGVAIAFRVGAHLGVDYFVGLLPKKGSQLLLLIASIFLIVTLAVIGYQGFTASQVVKSQLSPVLRVPMIYPYLAIPVGMVLSIIEVLWNLFYKAPRKGMSPDGN